MHPGRQKRIPEISRIAVRCGDAKEYHRKKSRMEKKYEAKKFWNREKRRGSYPLYV